MDFTSCSAKSAGRGKASWDNPRCGTIVLQAAEACQAETDCIGPAHVKKKILPVRFRSTHLRKLIRREREHGLASRLGQEAAPDGPVHGGRRPGHPAAWRSTGMKLRYLYVDRQGQLTVIRRAQVEALWQGHIGTDALS